MTAPRSLTPLQPIEPALPDTVIAQPWEALRRFTDARIALGRAGHSLPTAAHLQFQLAHAQARDAVHVALDCARILCDVQALGLRALALHSAAPDRMRYLQRPDWGRQLDAASRASLKAQAHLSPSTQPPDLCVVLADGLSAPAVHHHAVAVVQLLLQRLQQDRMPWQLAPVCVVEQGRVAIGDDIGACLGARMVVVLIGERPGLSSPDSLGIYMTWAPQPGRTDAQRNCISNVRSAGLAPAAAVATLHQLMVRARTLQCTGIGLKDESDPHALPG